VDLFTRNMIWQQFGAAIDMLENAIHACPDELWPAGRNQGFWYIAYHALFWLDLYLSDSVEGFVPPAPFTRDEMDPAGKLPEIAYTRAELINYLQHGREKCRARIANLTPAQAQERCAFSWLEMSNAEALLYNMRHVQHHAAQLNLLLRQKTDVAPPRWVRVAKAPLQSG
jgi:DinB superfamily